MTDSLSSYASGRADSPFPAYRFLQVRRVTQSAHTLNVDLTAPGWTALGGAALVLGGAGAIVIWGGLLGWLIGLALAIAVPHIPRNNEKVPYRYELLVELSTGELRPLTGETAAPTSYDQEPYDALGRRIHAFLGWAPYAPQAPHAPYEAHAPAESLSRPEDAGNAAQGPAS